MVTLAKISSRGAGEGRGAEQTNNKSAIHRNGGRVTGERTLRNLAGWPRRFAYDRSQHLNPFLIMTICLFSSISSSPFLWKCSEKLASKRVALFVPRDFPMVFS